MTEFTIYSIGDSAFLEQVLIAVAMIFNQDPDVSLITQAVKIGLVISVFVAAFSVIASGGKGMEWQWVLVGLLIYSTMFIPKAKVIIEDNYTGDVRIVENVPIGPAAAGGVISAIGLTLTETFEVAYGPIVPKVTETQFAESLKLLTDVRELGNSEAIWMGLNSDIGGGFADLRQSWANYIQDCSLRKIDLGMATADQFITSNATNMLELDSNLYGTKLFLDSADSQGSFETCADAWDSLGVATDLTGANSQNALKSLLRLNASNLASDGSETANTKLSASLQAVMGTAVDANNYMLLGLVEPVLMQATAAKYDSFQDVNGSLMVNQAIAQRNTQWATEQTLFMSIVRPMMAFFEAFLFAIAPIMAFVIVMGQKGIQLAGKYFAMAIWIQLWLPILAIVNLYIHTAASREVQAYNTIATHNWDSIYALNSASDVMQNWIATGGVLAASTPALALMLIYGSAITATHLAGRLQGGDSIDEKMATPDVRSTAPMANIAPMYSGNSVSGMGTEGYAGFATVSFGNAIGNMQRSTKSESEAAYQTWQSSLVEAHSRAEQGVLGERMINATQRSLASMDSESRTAIVDEARARMEDGTYTHGNQDQAVAAVMIGASVTGGVATPGKSLAPVSAGGDVTGSTTSQEKNTATSGASTSSRGSWRTGAGLNDNTTAALSRSLQQNVASDQTVGQSTTWNEQTGETFQSTASNALSKTKAYEDANSLATTLQSNTGQTSNVLAGSMFKNNTEGVDYLNQSMQLVPQSVRAEAQRLENQFVSQGLDENRARVAANLQALTSQGAYGDDSSQFARGAAIAATALTKAGLGNYGSTGDYSENKGIAGDVSAPDSRTGRLTGYDGSDKPTTIGQVTGDPTSLHNSNKETVTSLANSQLGEVEAARLFEATEKLRRFDGEATTMQDANAYINNGVDTAGQIWGKITETIPEDKLEQFGVDGTFSYVNDDGSYNDYLSSKYQSAVTYAHNTMAAEAGLSAAETEYFGSNVGFTKDMHGQYTAAKESLYTEYGERFGFNGERTVSSDYLAERSMAVMDQAAATNNEGTLSYLSNLRPQGDRKY